MSAARFSYETLTPLDPSADATTAATTTTTSGVDSDEYVVFRNEITQSSSTEAPSDKVGSATVDFFSLDVVDDCDTTPSPPVAVGEAEPERTLETGWFRLNSRWKSPMLQLHKEILDFCDFLSPTPEEASSRNAAIGRVSDVIKYIWPKCMVVVFRSY